MELYDVHVKNPKQKLFLSDLLYDLFIKIWPCLAVMGGVDQGLRIGGRCIHKASGKKGIILGLPREASITAKVQWDEVNNTIR